MRATDDGEIQASRHLSRLVWRVTLVAGVTAVVLGYVAYQRGTVFGLRFETALKLPLILGLLGLLVSIILSALRTGRVTSRGQLVERSVNRHQFYLHVSLLAVIAAVLVAGAVVLVYVDWVGLKGR